MVTRKTGKMLQYNIKRSKNSRFRMIIMQYSQIRDIVKLSAHIPFRSYLRRFNILDMCWIRCNISNFYRSVDLGK